MAFLNISTSLFSGYISRLFFFSPHYSVFTSLQLLWTWVSTGHLQTLWSPYLFHGLSHISPLNFPYVHEFHVRILPTTQHPLCVGFLSKIYSVQNSQSDLLLIINDTVSSPVTDVHTSQCFANQGYGVVVDVAHFFSNKLITKVLKPHVSLFILDALRLSCPKLKRTKTPIHQ